MLFWSKQLAPLADTASGRNARADRRQHDVAGPDLTPFQRGEADRSVFFNSGREKFSGRCRLAWWIWTRPSTELVIDIDGGAALRPWSRTGLK